VAVSQAVTTRGDVFILNRTKMPQRITAVHPGACAYGLRAGDLGRTVQVSEKWGAEVPGRTSRSTSTLP